MSHKLVFEARAFLNNEDVGDDDNAEACATLLPQLLDAYTAERERNARLTEEVAALRRDLEVARKDTERLDKLERLIVPTLVHGFWPVGPNLVQADSLRAAIDAALEVL